MLKLLGFTLFGKCVIAGQLPRHVVGCKHGTAGVMGSDALFNVRGKTDVSLFRERLALEKIHLEHFTVPEPALLRHQPSPEGFGRQEAAEGRER